MATSKPAATLRDVIVNADAFDKLKLPEKRTIIHPWLSEQGITLVYGWRGVGKSAFAMGILESATRGHAFGPWCVTVPVPCLYLDGEMAAQDVQGRFRELKAPSPRVHSLHIYNDHYANLQGLPRANLLSKKWRTEMKAILLDLGVRLWVADNIASLAPGLDENKKQDWDPINSWLLDLRFAGITTMLLHHENKMGAQRGSSAKEDNIDNAVRLRFPPDYVKEDGCKFIASFQKARVRHADLHLLGDTQFQLCPDEDGCGQVFAWCGVRREIKAEVLRLLDEGHKQIDVAQMVGITRGYASKIIAQASRDGFLTSKGKLTQSGLRHLQEDED